MCRFFSADLNRIPRFAYIRCFEKQQQHILPHGGLFMRFLTMVESILKTSQIQVNLSQLQELFTMISPGCFSHFQGRTFSKWLVFKRNQDSVFTFSLHHRLGILQACEMCEKESTQKVEHFLIGYQPKEGLKGKNCTSFNPFEKRVLQIVGNKLHDIFIRWWLVKTIPPEGCRKLMKTVFNQSQWHKLHGCHQFATRHNFLKHQQ